MHAVNSLSSAARGSVVECKIRVGGESKFEGWYSCSRGENLRDVLLRNALSLHRGLSCGGLGICGTCSVKVIEGGETQVRRSCQIRCFRDLEIELLSSP